MAKQTGFGPCVVKCERCGKEIEANKENGMVTAYVWRDGVNLCLECNKVAAKEASGR